MIAIFIQLFVLSNTLDVIRVGVIVLLLDTSFIPSKTKMYLNSIYRFIHSEHTPFPLYKPVT